jgi:hypothetical protein
MPLLRYFLFVGGSLLALLLVTNAAFPTTPAPEGLTSNTELPPVRILSDRKLPPKVVFDTSVVAPARAPAVPLVVAQARPQAPLPAAAPEMSASARVREAFAQLPQEDDAFEPKMSDMATVVVPEPKMYPAREPMKPRVAVAKPRTVRPMMTVAQQPQQPRGFFTW